MVFDFIKIMGREVDFGGWGELAPTFCIGLIRTRLRR
jgi:hypothetical protein